MAKKVSRDQRVALYGVDISHVVYRWAVDATVGEVVTVELDVSTDCFLAKKIVPEGVKDRPWNPTTQAEIHISPNGGTAWTPDLASHVFGWDFITRVGKPDLVRVYLQADADVLVINGTAPWEVQ